MDTNQRGANSRAERAAGKKRVLSARAEKLRDLRGQLRRAIGAGDGAEVASLEAQINRLQANASARSRGVGARRGTYKAAASGRGYSTKKSGDRVPKDQHLASGRDDKKVSSQKVADLSVSVFLDTDDAVTALKVMEGIQKLAIELGYSAPTITDVERGSVKAWFSAKWNSSNGRKTRAVSAAKAKEAVMELEQYGRLQVKNLQADVDAKNVNSAVMLATSLAELDRAAFHLGAILFVKYPLPDGSHIVTCRTMSTREIEMCERTPGICSKPELVEQNLALLLAEDDVVEDGQKEIGQ